MSKNYLVKTFKLDTEMSKEVKTIAILEKVMDDMLVELTNEDIERIVNWFYDRYRLRDTSTTD